MAEDITKRVDNLEEDMRQQESAYRALLEIVKDIDGTVRSVQAHAMVIDGRLDTIDARIGLYHNDTSLSFHQVAKTMATKEDLAELERRMNARFDQVVGDMNGKFDQVLGSFQQVLAVLDERLPKQGE